MPESRIALITGSSRGIGAATARVLAGRGYRVCINFRTRVNEAHRLAEELASSNPLVVQADVSSGRDVQRLFATLDAADGHLAVLVNNAGSLSTQSRVDELSEDRINEVLRNNVTSAFLCAQEAVRRMSTRHGGTGGAIVNVSSVAALTGSPHEYTDYAASKAGIDALTTGLAKEVAAEGIRVNAVRPGFIDTELHADGGEPDRVSRLAPRIPMQRGGSPDEIARVIAWLASDEASYVTGSFINAGGGLP